MIFDHPNATIKQLCALMTLMNDHLKSRGGAIGYADDVILIVNGDDPITMASLMEWALRRVCEWGDYHGLTFNPDKTTTVIFHRGRKRDYTPNVYMGG